MRKNRFLLTYLLIAVSISSYCQYSYEDKDDYEENQEVEEGSLEIEETEVEEFEYYEINETVEEVPTSRAFEYEGFTESNSNIPYLNQDTTFKTRYTDDAYQYYENPPPEPKKDKVDKNENEKGDTADYEPSRRRTNAGPGFGAFASILFYVFLALAVGLIGFLIFQAVNNLKIQKKPKLKRVDPIVEIEQDIEKIEELDPNDLRVLIRKAKESGNFTLATRYYFLLYLEQLQKRNAIKYDRDKTNADYLSEIESKNTEAQFVKLSYLFEYVWYGKKPLDETSFNSLEIIFHQQLTTEK